MERCYHKQIACSKHVARRHVDVLLLDHMRRLHETFGGFIHAVRKKVLLAATIIIVTGVRIALIILSLNC